MLFHISTPQTVGEYIAKQKARRASKRKSAHGSDVQPSTKKQKLLHGSQPPASNQAPDPAPALANATTFSRPINEKSNLVDCSLPPAQAQADDVTDLGPGTKKRKAEHCSNTPAQGHDVANYELATQSLELNHDPLPPAQTQAHDMTDLQPHTKKPKLSYANLPPARIRNRTSNVEFARTEADYYRKRLGRWCISHGFDQNLLDPGTLPDTLLMSPNFDVHNYMTTQSSKVHSDAYGPSELDVYNVDNLSPENLMPESAGMHAHNIRKQTLGDLSCHSLALDAAPQVQPTSSEVSIPYTPAQGPISKGCPGSGDETSHPQLVQNMTAEAPLAFGGKISEVCPHLGDQTSRLSSSSSSSSINSTLKSPVCCSSDPNVGYNTMPANSDQISSVGLDPDIGDDTAAGSSEQIAPLSPDSSLRDETTRASSSQVSSVGRGLDKGGRPRGRKPRAPKTPKGPTRLQKNHPVKARVNIDVWENILVFCPPDFLLKARTISPTFRSVLREDSPIWKIARVNHFGPDIPDPPLGLSEPQYADLLTGMGCQTRGCASTRTRKTYWAFQKRLCIECFQKAFIPPRGLKRVFKELVTSQTPQYRTIAQYYQAMDEFLPGMKFDRWDNYQWLGNYDTTPSWGQLYRSGQYTGYPAAAYANFSSELANFVGNEYDVEQGRFLSKEPMHGKTCPPQDAIDAWFDAKRAANDALVPELQAVENWYESYKRNNQKAAKELRMSRERFYEEQATLAGLNAESLMAFESYRAAIAISKPASEQSWKILLRKIMAQYEVAKNLTAEREAEEAAEREAEEDEIELERIYRSLES